ncbi:MAG: aminomethyl-transferring glycine dehydrogenase subunit GcvPA [Bacillota bacterium]
MEKNKIVYPYIPNSVPKIREQMLAKIGVEDVEVLYSAIPESLRIKNGLQLPEPLLSEYELKRHVEELLKKNISCDDYLSFLGGGCWQHYVPAVCDEIANRAEFLTAYGGETYSDLGKYQVIFEYASMLTELLEMDVVGVPTFDWLAAASTSLRMAARITDRSKVLVSQAISREKLLHMHNYCPPEVTSIETIAHNPKTGLLELADLKNKLTADVAAVYIENPGFLGTIETQAAEIAKLAHTNESLFIVGVNPISLGILAPPGSYGADIVCGEGQSLGVRMNGGGGLTGFIAVKDVDEHVGELPTLLISITEEEEGTGFGFVQARGERTSYAAREFAREFIGTTTGLWGLVNAVYLALMGPEGMREIGETILQKSHYAKKLLAAVPGLQIPFSAGHFNEFVVNFDQTGKKVSEINKSLLGYKIFGGYDLSKDYPQLGQSALYAVNETHSVQDIHRLSEALKEVAGWTKR